MAKVVTVTVSKAGQTTIETEGFVGAECMAATEGLERKLGGATSRDFKPEFAQAEQDADAGLKQ